MKTRGKTINVNQEVFLSSTVFNILHVLINPFKETEYNKSVDIPSMQSEAINLQFLRSLCGKDWEILTTTKGDNFRTSSSQNSIQKLELVMRAVLFIRFLQFRLKLSLQKLLPCVIKKTKTIVPIAVVKATAIIITIPDDNRHVERNDGDRGGNEDRI